MPRSECDILVAGGGLSGMLAAAALGSAGFEVVCVDRRSEHSSAGESKSDTRTTALLLPAKSVLTQAGIWQDFSEAATPLRSLKIADANEEFEIRQAVEFSASEIERNEFGWNIANRDLRSFLEERIGSLPTVSFLRGRAAKRVLNRDCAAIAELSDGSRVAARLVVAADGRNSIIRDRLGIGVIKSKSRQTALAFSVSHRSPHGEMSVEIHKRGGPFTLVPVADIEGCPASAVVWIESKAKAEELSSLCESDFNAEITKRSCGLFGPLKLVSQIGAWPVVSQLANSFSAGRTALIAETAHVLPPIGAQGLNLSIADISSLSALLQNSDPGSRDFSDLLALDGRDRRLSALSRGIGVNALNIASSWEFGILRSIRAFGLAAAGGMDAIRKPLMRLGLGER